MTTSCQSIVLPRVIPALLVVTVVAMVAYANWRDAQRSRDVTLAPPVGTPGAPSTSRQDLVRTIGVLEERLAAKPHDGGAAVLMGEALLRQARVTSDGRLALKAEQVLLKILKDEPMDYEARRELAAVYLSQHRFRDAMRAAERARDMRPADFLNYGAIGDGYLEIGEYDKAFDAFQRMMGLRPGAPAYARAAYARELQGDLEGALRLMKMAAGATTAHDPESLAWHHAQIGHLYFQMGKLVDARREYERAAFIFPDHPYAMSGIARVKAARGDYEGALALSRRQLEKGPTPELAAQVGDLCALLGQHAEAERFYVMAEQLERDGWKVEQPQPGALARFLAERDRHIDEAVRLAEQAAAEREDIFTEDALAWAYFKAGRVQDAIDASERAMRTGTRDRRILYHAAAIRNAVGDMKGARELVARALDGNPHFDPIAAPAAIKLLDELDSATAVARR